MEKFQKLIATIEQNHWPVYGLEIRKNGERILTEDWVKEATSVKTPCREGGYGYFIWKYKDGFRITGKWGKRCFVFPATGIIVTYLSDMQNNSEDLTEAVMECIGAV